MSTKKFLISAPVLAALASGCPSNPPAATDAGVDAQATAMDSGMPPESDGGAPGTDSGRSDGGSRADAGAPDATRDAAGTRMLSTCAAPRMVTLTTGMNTLTGSTADGVTGPLTLGEMCSPPGARAPQEVLAMVVPGTGAQVLEFDMHGGMTANNFDTLVEFRGTACATAPTDPDTSCFDDTGLGDIQSSGQLRVMGGTTVYFVVTGFPGREGGANVASGPWTMNVTLTPNSPPTLTAASAIRVGTAELHIRATGMDPDSNATGVRIQFLDSAGMPISLDPEDDTAVGPFRAPFSVAPTTMAFTDATSVGPGSADIPVVGTAANLRVTVYDRFGEESAPLTVPFTTATGATFGMACSATALCTGGNVCEAGTCQAPPALRTACTGAPTITLAAPAAGMTTMMSRSVMIPTGDGIVEGTCGGAGGETLVNVTVPAGFQLTATTAVTGTDPETDTVVYIRQACADGSTERACNDDVEDAEEDDVRSTATVATTMAATYTVFVDSYEAVDAATPVTLELRLRAP